jgi:hypothetical protein
MRHEQRSSDRGRRTYVGFTSVAARCLTGARGVMSVLVRSILIAIAYDSAARARAEDVVVDVEIRVTEPGRGVDATDAFRCHVNSDLPSSAARVAMRHRTVILLIEGRNLSACTI